MIQSKQPPADPWIDHSSVPFETTVIVIKVELVSPDSRQPEFVPFGFVDGFETVPVPKSKLLVALLGGSI